MRSLLTRVKDARKTSGCTTWLLATRTVITLTVMAWITAATTCGQSRGVKTDITSALRSDGRRNLRAFTGIASMESGVRRSPPTASAAIWAHRRMRRQWPSFTMKLHMRHGVSVHGSTSPRQRRLAQFHTGSAHAANARGVAIPLQACSLRGGTKRSGRHQASPARKHRWAPLSLLATNPRRAGRKRARAGSPSAVPSTSASGWPSSRGGWSRKTSGRARDGRPCSAATTRWPLLRRQEVGSSETP